MWYPEYTCLRHLAIGPVPSVKPETRGVLLIKYWVQGRWLGQLVDQRSRLLVSQCPLNIIIKSLFPHMNVLGWRTRWSLLNEGLRLVNFGGVSVRSQIDLRLLLFITL